MVYSLMLSSALVGIVAIAYMAYLVWRVLREDEGTPRMKEIAAFIRDGARAYMKKQYGMIAVIVSAITIALALLVSPLTGASYAIGAICSSIVGFIGLNLAVRANSRTANAARLSGLGRALDIAFKGGSVLGLGVVGIGLLGVAALYCLYGGLEPAKLVWATGEIVGFSFGASTVALFARVGGGIYTKAADIGADLVGKVEKGIPEDDPRNPGVIADNVGDNVGDCAGMGADLFESYVGAIISAMVIGAVIYAPKIEWVLLPLFISAVGIISTILASFSVRGDPEKALTRASLISAIAVAILSFFASRQLLGGDWLGPYAAILSGLLAGVVVGETSDYFTSKDKPPAQRVARAAQAGAAINILTGFSMGFLSTFVPIIFIAIAEMVSFLLAGVYGVAISAVGMLSIAGLVVAADAYGPITDNAAGIAEMAGLEEGVRNITDKLDSVGNTMKSISKGFAIGSAALTAIAFFVALTQIPAFSAYAAKGGGLGAILNLLNAKTFAGILIGSAMPAVFTALVVLAVSDGAFKLVDEIRRQFREVEGLMEGRAKPDYAACVSIATSNALRKLVAPGLMAIIAPIAVGLLLGIEALVGLIAGAIVSGLLLGLFQGNVGNTWDNAKKYIEEGRLGGKGSPAHAAAVIGDTCGDPMKDSSGPAINIFIKLMSVTALVATPALIRILMALP
ncbi:MAG: sodium-translocating pyrophosphatase [Candidatus Bathyarchaeia archaeon]